MNLYRIKHMYFPFLVIIDFLPNVDISKRCELLTCWTRGITINTMYNTNFHREWTPFDLSMVDIG